MAILKYMRKYSEYEKNTLAARAAKKKKLKTYKTLARTAAKKSKIKLVKPLPKRKKMKPKPFFKKRKFSARKLNKALGDPYKI